MGCCARSRGVFSPRSLEPVGIAKIKVPFLHVTGARMMYMYVCCEGVLTRCDCSATRGRYCLTKGNGLSVRVLPHILKLDIKRVCEYCKCTNACTIRCKKGGMHKGQESMQEST